MYLPEHFVGPDDGLTALLTATPLADLITAGADGLLATPLPLLFEPGVGSPQTLGTLVGHVARNNPHWRAGLIEGGAESLVILRGPDAYISPSAYASKAEHGRVVPTWNYLTAHVRGRLVAHDDAAWTESVVRRLTDHFERRRSAPWSVDDAPPRYIRGQVNAIVGLEFVIASIETKYKLSQNRSAADRSGVVDALAAGSPSEREVAAHMSPQ